MVQTALSSGMVQCDMPNSDAWCDSPVGQKGHVEVVKALLTNNKVDVNLQHYVMGEQRLDGESRRPCGSRQGVAHEQQG